MAYQRGRYCSLYLLPVTTSSQSRTLEGLFELTQRLSSASKLSLCNAKYQKTETNPDGVFVNNTLFYNDP